MRALTLDREGSLELGELPAPVRAEHELLVETVAVGICGTDRRLVERGWGRDRRPDRMILGHESLGRVLEAPDGSGFRRGDLVAGLVRRPDPLPCRFCAAGTSDLCENGRYTERGISAHGFAAERVALDPGDAVPVDRALGLAGVLLEPASIVAKAWERIERVRGELPGRALVLGAGPIGQLAALFGVERGYEVHVVDQVRGGPKQQQVERLGAAYHVGVAGLDRRFDAVIECSGALLSEAVRQAGSSGAICLVSGEHDAVEPLAGVLELAHELLMRNKWLVGIVNSNRSHFVAAHEVLRRADGEWLLGLLRPRVALTDWRAALVEPDSSGIKAVIELVGASAGG